RCNSPSSPAAAPAPGCTCLSAAILVVSIRSGMAAVASAAMTRPASPCGRPEPMPFTERPTHGVKQLRPTHESTTVGPAGLGLRQEPAGQRVERGEAVRGIGAAAEAVIGMEKRHAALPRRRLIAGRVADEDGVPEPVALDQHLQIGRLGEPGVAPALEVPEKGAEPGPSLKRLDVTGLAVAHDEERIARGQPSKP